MFHMYVLVTLVALNVLAMFFFAYDKLCAKRGSWRVSERKLLGVGFLGPIGAILGMVVFRHKVSKSTFLFRGALVLALSLLAHWIVLDFFALVPFL